MVIQVRVTGQSMRWYDNTPQIADQSVQFVQFQFLLSPDWEGYEVTAQFTQWQTYNQLLDDGYCYLPAELKAGNCSVSLFGYKPGHPNKATTVPLSFMIQHSGFVSSGETPIPPTPDLYEQLLRRFREDKTGTTDHSQLSNRDAADQHPIGAITGLKEILDKVETSPGGNAGQGGFTQAQINALHGMFKVCLFDDTKDVDGAISAFETAFGIAGGGEVPDEPDQPDIPDVPVVKTYSVSAELINVTSSNKATTVNENTSYTTTMTAADGYNLDSVRVIMGGVDITATAYANGVISIPAVTGDVEILATASVAESEAELITDGLLGYWDLRNPAEVVTKDWHWAYPSNLGSGDLYGSVAGGSQGTASLPTIDSNYGHKGFVIVNGSETFPNDTNYAKFGTEFTFVVLAHGAMPVNMFGINGIAGSNISPRWNFCGQYYNTADTVVNLTNVGCGNGDSAEDYNFVVKRVSGSNMKVVVDTSDYEFNGEDYSDFAYWTQYVYTHTLNNNGTVIACAVYNRALTDVEIEEVRAFMKTLEVTA